MKFDRSHIIVMMICVFLIIFSLLTIFMGLDPVLIIATICALIAIFLIITKINSYIDKKRRIKEDEKAMVRIAEMQKKWKEEDEKRKGIDDFTEEELSILPSWKQDRAMKVTRDALVKSQCSLIEAANIMFERDMKRNLEEAQSKLESGEITEEDFEKIREFLKRQEELRTKEIRELEDKNKEKIRQFDKNWEDMKIRLQEIKKSSHQS